MTIEVRPIVEDELGRYMDLCQIAFGGKPEEGEAERIRELIGLERVHAAFDGDRMVGTDAAYSLHLTVPGTDWPMGDPPPSGTPPPGVPTAGLTRVSVAATHRRRGVLTAMIEAHFADAVAHDEPLSALWASELPIYGRFGYGPASDSLRVRYDNRNAQIRRPDEPDTLAYAEGDEVETVLPDLWERFRQTRAGHYHRTEAWWRHRHHADHEFWRGGASPLRHVVATRDGRPVGYAVYRQAPRWDDHDLPEGEVRVIEVVGFDLRARHSLWWFLSNIDLHPKVSFSSLPVDSELPWLATNQRAVHRHLADGLQVRVLDVVAALEARRWAEPGELGFEVSREHHEPTAGSYRLTIAGSGRARVEETDTPPEVRLHPAALGALYLGSRPAAPLAVAGWVVGSDEAVARLTRLFAWPDAAWCNEVF